MRSDDKWIEIIGEVEVERFIGLLQELDAFWQLTNRTPSHCLIFYISDQGGVGKTVQL